MKIYLFAFLMDLIVFTVLMYVFDVSGRGLAFSDTQAALLLVANVSGHLLGSFGIGQVLNRRRARGLVALATLGCLAMALGLFFGRHWGLLLVLALGLGLSTGVWFTSFQTLMRGEAPPGSLAQSVARYTLAWSAGMGCGFLLSGLLATWAGPLSLAAATTAFCLLILAMLFRHRQRAHHEASADGEVETHGAGPGVNTRRWVPIGWLLIMSATVCLGPLRSLWPKLSAETGNAPWVAGVWLGTQNLVQAGFGYLLQRWPGLRYRLWPLLAAQGTMLAATALLWFGDGAWLTLALFALIGLASGFLFFASVYYASNDAHSSRNVGINEAMMAAGQILGVMLCVTMKGRFDNEPRMVIPPILFLVALLGTLQWLWLRPRRPVPETAPDAEA